MLVFGGEDLLVLEFCVPAPGGLGLLLRCLFGSPGQKARRKRDDERISLCVFLPNFRM